MASIACPLSRLEKLQSTACNLSSRSRELPCSRTPSISCFFLRVSGLFQYKSGSTSPCVGLDLYPWPSYRHLRSLGYCVCRHCRSILSACRPTIPPPLNRPRRPRPPRGWHRKKTLVTEGSASASPVLRESWVQREISFAKLHARVRPRLRGRPWMPARRVLCRDLLRGVHARCVQRRTCVKAHESATPHSAHPIAAFAWKDRRAAPQAPLRERGIAIFLQARHGYIRAAQGAAGRARAASAVFSHLGGDGSQCLRTLDAELLADLRLDLGGELRVFLQEVAGVVLALAHAVRLVLVPGSGLVDHAATDAELQDLTLEGHPFAVENIEQRLAERRRDLVLHHLYAGFGADHLVAALDAADAANVEPARRVELERVASGGRLGVAEHDADLHADLVDEDDERVGALDVGGELPQRLAHQPRLQTHLRLAHFALDLGFRRERRHRIDHDAVDRGRAHQHVGDLERLLAVVRLREEELRGIDAEALRVLRIERVLRVDEGGGAAQLLDVGDDLEREG